MIIIFLRTVLIYVFLIVILRLMGKRQLGELEMSDLVISLLLSEIATIPITDRTSPLSHAVIPILTLASLEFITSALTLKLPRFKKLLSSEPTVLICNGRVLRAEMKKVRVSLDELLCELRQNNVSDIAQVRYAILETNGKISVITNAADTPPTSKDLAIPAPENGIMHVVYCDGVFYDKVLTRLGLDRNWLNKQIKNAGLSPDKVFFVLVDDGGNVRIQNNDT